MKISITPKNILLFLKHHITDQPYDFPKQDNDMNVVSLGLNLDDFYKKLLSYKNVFKINEIERIKYKGNQFPVYEVDINEGSKYNIFILSGTHGNEQAGMIATLKLFELFKKEPIKYKDFHIKIIAPNNPVSVKYFSRFNGDGIDVNRDFKRQRTLETKLVIEAIKRFNPDFSITLHEGPQEEGTFIYANKFATEAFVIKVLDKAKRKGVILSSRNYFSGKLKIPGYFPVKGWLSFWVKVSTTLLKLQTYGDYATQKKIPVITIESSWQFKDKDKRVNAHLEIVKAILDEL